HRRLDGLGGGLGQDGRPFDRGRDLDVFTLRDRAGGRVLRGGDVLARRVAERLDRRCHARASPRRQGHCRRRWDKTIEAPSNLHAVHLAQGPNTRARSAYFEIWLRRGVSEFATGWL